MKKKFTKFFVILVAVICQTGICPLFVYSQSYHKLIRTNTYWDNYIISDEPIFSSCYAYANRIYFTGNDTVINGFTYQISREYPFSGYNPVPDVMCPPLVVNDESYPTGSFIREDTVTRKVYIYVSGWTPPDQLLYDFSLQIGDTLKSEYNGGGNFIVTAIDTVTLNDGELRKEFIFNVDPSSNYYIESLGGSEGLFTPYFEPNYGGFFCISENDTNLWGTECNYFFVGMKEQQELKLSLYPNPAEDKITIEDAGETIGSKLAIGNIEGQQLISRQIAEPKMKIDISNLPCGVYFVRLTSDRTVQVVKFIKQ